MLNDDSDIRAMQQRIATLEAELAELKAKLKSWYPLANIFQSSQDYDIGGESRKLRAVGVPFMQDVLTPADGDTPLCLADFGCWSGRHLPLLRELAGESGKVIGIDGPWAKTRLAKAEETYDIHRATLIQSRLEQVELPENSVHGGICWRVLHNLTTRGELTAVLQRLHKLLVNDAPFVIAVRAAHSWMPEATVPVSFRSYLHHTERDDLYFSASSIQNTFTQQGFLVHWVETFHEGELVNDQRVYNEYHVVGLTCTKSKTGG